MGWRAAISLCPRCRRGEDEEAGDEKGLLQGKVRTEGFPSLLAMTGPETEVPVDPCLQGDLKFCSD